MGEINTRKVSKIELEMSRRSAIIHSVNIEIEKKDLEHAIKRQINVTLFEVVLGNPYITDGEERRNVFLNFKNEEKVNELMKSRPFKLSGQEFQISRHIPKSCHISGRVTHTVLLILCQTEQELTEYDLKKYFDKFGQIIACEWQNNKEVILQFQDYDSVDQIILHDVSHMVNGIKVDVRKTVTMIKATASAYRSYCIHVSSMPTDVTSGELAGIFSVPVNEILLRPGNRSDPYLVSKDRLMSEAWIKHRFDEKTALTLADKYSNKVIRGVKIRCNVVQEPVHTSELCRDYEKGSCKYSSDQCNYKHIMCNEADECEDRECYYGHSIKRKIRSNERFMRDSNTTSYRVRIGNLPATVTIEQLLERLNIHSQNLSRIRLPDEQVSDGSMVAYLVNQPSENLLRRKIREWHNKPFSHERSNKIQCQLEYNMEFFDWDDHSDATEASVRSRTSSTISDTVSNTRATTTKPAPWYKSEKVIPWTSTQLEPSSGTESELIDADHMSKSARKRQKKIRDQEPSDMNRLAPQWGWTGEQLSSDEPGTRAMYSLVHKKNKGVTAVIMIYKTTVDRTVYRCAQRKKIVLEKLQGLDGIPRLITSNFNARMEVESESNPWIIMERIEGVTLGEYIRTHSITFRDQLIITLNLLNIVKQIHSRHVVHRHIHPDNIMIRTQLDKNSEHTLPYYDMNQLVVIGFRHVCLTEDDQSDHREILEDNRTHILNSFYQAPQLQRQSSTDNNNDDLERKNLTCSPSIDISYVCAILFWLITKHAPKESRNIHEEAPHQQKNHASIVRTELTRATGIWSETEKRGPLEQHLRLIFDHGFGSSDQQWSTEALTYQLQHMLQLATKSSEENSVFPCAVSKKQTGPSVDSLPPNSFLQLASLIDGMKRQFEMRYSDVHWSTSVKSQWFGHSQQVKNRDILSFQNQNKSITISMIFCAEIQVNQELMITVTARVNGITDIELPLGVWKQYQQEPFKEEIRKTFELELKTLIDVLYKSKDYIICSNLR